MRLTSSCLLAALGLSLVAGNALADKIKNPTAVFSGLDKITGRIISFEVSIDETVQFGALQLTPRVCYTRPATESPNTDGFIEVDEVTLENKYRRIFSGWMFAASPGLHGIEHAVYDIWLTDCKGGSTVVAEPKLDQDPAPVAATRERRRQGDSARSAPRDAPRPSAGDRIDIAPPRGVPRAAWSAAEPTLLPHQWRGRLQSAARFRSGSVAAQALRTARTCSPQQASSGQASHRASCWVASASSAL